MDGIDTSGKALVDHWKWAADKGEMNANTAAALKAACTQVLGVLDGWESLDVRAMDVQDVCRRFQNKRNKDFKPKSLETYKQRFEKAVKLFLAYADNPSGWKAPSQERAPRRERKVSSQENGDAAAASSAERAPAPGSGSGLVDYPFPLREGRFAYLRLPADLRVAEVKRLSAYLGTLAIDAESQG
jgi:hypothetical protein